MGSVFSGQQQFTRQNFFEPEQLPPVKMEPDHMNDQTFLMMYDEVIGAREAPLLIPDQVLTQKGK